MATKQYFCIGNRLRQQIKIVLAFILVIMFLFVNNVFAEPYSKGFSEFEKLKWGQESGEWERKKLLPFSIVNNRKFYKLKK